MRPIICGVADVHLGNHRRFGGPVEASLNRRCRLALDVYRRAVERAVELRATALVVLGDLYDDDRPLPQLVTEVQKITARGDADGLMTVFLLGNHEQTSVDARDHALGPLEAAGGVVVSEPRTLLVGRGEDAVELGLVPFHPGIAENCVQVAADLLEWRTTGQPRVLCIHAGVRDEKTPPYLQDAKDAIKAETLVELARRLDVATVLAGNWHQRRRWQARGEKPVDILQLGALVPTGWDNPGIDGYGTLAVCGPALHHEALPGPRFVRVMSDSDLKVQLAFAEKRHVQLFVQWEADPDGMAGATSRLAELSEQGKLTGEVIAGEAQAAEKAWAAAEAARSATSLEEALTAYIAEMDLPVEVDRDDVLARSRKYLGL